MQGAERQGDRTLSNRRCVKGERAMPEYRLGEMEMRFAEIIWENEPLASGELVKLCEKKLSWKKSTTYTILHRLCDRELFLNEGGIVTSLVSKEDFFAGQSEKYVQETFGSLPKFLAAFTRSKKLSDKEIEEIKRIIEENRGEGGDEK